MKKKEKRYVAPQCTSTTMQTEYFLLAGSVHVNINESSSNIQNWGSDGRTEGIPHKSGTDPDDSWFGTKTEVAP